MATAVSADTRAPAADPAAPMSHRQIMEALSGLMLGLFVAILSSTIVSNALPTIISDLHATQTTYTWVITSSLLAVTITTPIWGKLADLMSKKLLVQLGLIVYILGSAYAGLAQNPAMLISARVVQGIGAGGLTALSQVIMAVMISPRQRGRYSGYLGAVFALATIGGPLIGGVIVDASWLGWRWCFYVCVPFAIVALIVLQKTLHLPTYRRKVKIDWAGSALIASSVALLLVWVSFADHDYDWISWQTGAMVGGAVVLGLLFLLVETRAAEPIVPLWLFRLRTMSLAVVASLMVGVAMFGATTFLSQYFQLARGDSPTKAGIMTLPMIFGLALASTIAGRVITRTGRWKVFLVAGGLLLTAGYAMLGTIRHDTTYWQVAVFMAAVGVGLGLTVQNLVLSVQNQVHPKELGSASATVAFFRTLGGAIGVSALGAVLGTKVTDYTTSGLARLGGHAAASSGGDGIPNLPALPAPVRAVVEAAFGHGIGDVFLYTAPFAFAGLIAILFLKEVPLRTTGALSPAHEETPRTTQREQALRESGPYGDVKVGGPGMPTEGGPVAPAGLVRGRVQSGDGTPVPHVAVTLIDVHGQQLGRATTDDGGRYELRTPGRGSYVLIAASGDRAPQAATLMVGERPVEFDLTLTGSGGLSGTVHTGGEPVSGAMVIATDSRGEVVATTTTGVDGEYAVGGLATGIYTLAVRAPGRPPCAVTAEVGGDRDRNDVELPPGLVLRGTVRAEGRGPLPDARVTLVDTEGNVVAVATTDADGGYAFGDLSRGEYVVTATGYPPVATAITLGGQGEDAHDMWLGHAS